MFTMDSDCVATVTDTVLVNSFKDAQTERMMDGNCTINSTSSGLPEMTSHSGDAVRTVIFYLVIR